MKMKNAAQTQIQGNLFNWIPCNHRTNLATIHKRACDAGVPNILIMLLCLRRCAPTRAKKIRFPEICSNYAL
jgi:hypothetical protein